jgi:hypothetical protein
MIYKKLKLGSMGSFAQVSAVELALVWDYTTGEARR